MKSRLNLFFFGLALSGLGSTGRTQEIPTPSEHLKRPLGVDFELADWDEVRTYFEALDVTSSSLQLSRVGTSTEGRPFVMATISSAENLARLPELRRYAEIISDPRGTTPEQQEEALQEGRLFLMISCNMHSTETASPQFAMEFAYRLITSESEPWSRARERMVVFLMPTINPDGLDHVVSWYRQNVHTPYEGSRMLKLYQYYTGHDNNRDWFALTQAETRIVTRLLYKEWHPQVYWDVHEQGSRRERFFVPPFKDPLNPNLDPAIITAIDALGSRALMDMTRKGLSGISTGVTYDMWWNGGNRNVPVRHNIIGLLTEASSINIGTPIWRPLDALSQPRGLSSYSPSHRFPWPWPGGWWRLRDIIDYELAFGESLLGSLSREPQHWMRNAAETAQRNIERVRQQGTLAWLIPSDNADVGAARRLADLLLASGVEMEVASTPVRADGRTYPTGSLVIRTNQPYATHVKDLFEIQRYPDGDPPYDVAGWTLPLLFGLRRVEVRHELTVETIPVENAAQAVAAFYADMGIPEEISDPIWDPRDGGTWARVFERLKGGLPVSYIGPFESTDTEDYWMIGKFVPAPADSLDWANWPQDLKLPRIGLYAPWSGLMDEGWMRWVLDTWGVPYVRVRNEMLRSGSLQDFLDVLILPSLSDRQLDAGRLPGSVPEPFAGGLDPEGAIAVEEFVRAGGNLIAIDRAGEWAVDLFQLPLINSVAQAEDFYCPGSVVRTLPERAELTVGLPASLPVFFSHSRAWSLREDVVEQEGWEIQTLLRYAPTRTLLSGYIREPEAIAGHPAWLQVNYQAGHIHLFGFRPQYRGWSQAAFATLFRAILLTDS